MEKEEKSNKSKGSIVGIVVIILVLLIGAYWFWKQNRTELTNNKDTALEEIDETNFDELLLEDETNFDELLLEDDLTTFDEVDAGF